MSVPPAAMRRLMRELSELQNSPPEGIRVQTNEDNMLDVTGIIEGPEGTPYAGGYFKVKFKFTEEFPAAPPKCWFATKIFHPNVSSAGEICVNTLKKDWQSSYGIGHILVTVKCLLIYPNPESALDEEAGKLLLENYSSYCDRARLITSVHATPRVRPVEFDTPSKVEEEDKECAKASGSGSTTPLIALTSTSTTPASTPTFTLPISTPASAPTQTQPVSLKDSLPTPKDRHASPSPLSTADANLNLTRPTSLDKDKNSNTTSNVGTGGEGVRLGSGGTKAVKRAATDKAVSGAEKRKKALKRL